MSEIKIQCAYDKLVPTYDLKVHPKNRNKHPDSQIGRLSQIIEYQGFRIPIKVSNLSGFVTSGHGRLLAAIKLQMTEVPVDFQDYESEAQEYADIQADNAIALWAELDPIGIKDDILQSNFELDTDLLGIKYFEALNSNFNNTLEDAPPSDVLNKKYLLEIEFPDEQALKDEYAELSSRGLIVRIK